MVESSGLEQADALVRFHFKVDTETISDEKFFELFAKVDWCIKRENERFKQLHGLNG